MTFTETYLAKLDEALREQAAEAVIRPRGRESFDYGEACGIYAGIHRARDILMEMISEDKGHDDQL